MNRERLLTQTFVELADTLVTDFDVVDLVHVLATRCVDLTDVDAAGIMLADPSGTLHVIGSSSERIRVLELLEVQISEGPCLDSFHSGQPVYADLHTSELWPTVRPAAVESGFGSVVALPMRLRSESIGALNMFRTSRTEPDPGEIALCRALADVATIALVQERTVRQSRAVAGQLQAALNTRIVVEQAKGVLSERSGIDMNVAFDRMRAYARNSNLLLGDVARAVVEGRVKPEAI
jgi:transcriptional regulator with GAF, ATPase, and Fis domain